MPTDQIDRVSRYVGVGEAAPTLTTLGSADWEHAKRRAQKAVQDVARELLAIYAARQVAPGTRLLARHRLAERAGGIVPLHRDARPVARHQRGQGGHGAPAADGSPDLRRCRLRQDRGRPARRLQGGDGGQAGGHPRADDDPGPAALQHLPRASWRPSPCVWRCSRASAASAQQRRIVAQPGARATSTSASARIA